MKDKLTSKGVIISLVVALVVVVGAVIGLSLLSNSEAKTEPTTVATRTLTAGAVGVSYDCGFGLENEGILETKLAQNSSLPSGLTLDGVNIVGTPAVAGDYSFKIEAVGEKSGDVIIPIELTITEIDPSAQIDDFIAFWEIWEDVDRELYAFTGMYDIRPDTYPAPGSNEAKLEKMRPLSHSIIALNNDATELGIDLSNVSLTRATELITDSEGVEHEIMSAEWRAIYGLVFEIVSKDDTEVFTVGASTLDQGRWYNSGWVEGVGITTANKPGFDIHILARAGQEHDANGYLLEGGSKVEKGVWVIAIGVKYADPKDGGAPVRTTDKEHLALGPCDNWIHETPPPGIPENPGLNPKSPDPTNYPAPGPGGSDGGGGKVPPGTTTNPDNPGRTTPVVVDNPVKQPAAGEKIDDPVDTPAPGKQPIEPHPGAPVVGVDPETPAPPGAPVMP